MFDHDRHGITLHHISGTDHCNRSGYSENDRHCPAFHPVEHGVHGAAVSGAVGTADTVSDREKRFSILCSHTENTGEHAPENRTGTAEDDRRCNTYDIADADSRSEGNSQRGERRIQWQTKN